MKPFTLFVTIIITVIITAVAIRLLYIKELRSTRSLIDAQASELLMRKNREGKLIAEKQVAEIRIKDLERSDPKFAEQLKKDFDVKLKNLRAYIAQEFKATGQGNATVWRLSGTDELTIDTTNSFVLNDTNSELTIQAQYLRKNEFYYLDRSGDTVVIKTDKNGDAIFPFQPFAIVVQDGYLDLQAEVYDELNTPYTYTYSDTLKFAFHMKSEGFLKNKKLYGSGMLTNPNALITNSKAILVNEYRDKRFGIGPSVSYGVSPNGLQWNVGVSVHYSLIRF